MSDHDSTDPVVRLRLIDEQTAELLKWQQALRELASELTRELEALTAAASEVEHPSTDLQRADLTTALQQIRVGVTWGDGVIPQLRPLVGRPGLAETERTLARLQAERAEWAAKVGVDPEARALYRLREKVGKHYQDGRFVRPGEVVELTHRQAVAWIDKFEPVAEIARG